MTLTPTRTLVLALAALAAVACSDAGGSTSPIRTLSDANGSATGGTNGGTSGGDTAVTHGATPGIHGRVWQPSGTSSDTTIYVIVPGAQVQILTQPADGGAGTLVATLTTDAAGSFDLDPIADGTYQAKSTPAGSGLQPATAFNILVQSGTMVGYAEVNLVYTKAP